jgi:hypothetical protein
VGFDRRLLPELLAQGPDVEGGWSPSHHPRTSATPGSCACAAAGGLWTRATP